MVSLAQPGGTQKEVLGAPNRPEIERWRGKEPVVESGDEQKMCVETHPGTPAQRSCPLVQIDVE